MICSIWSWIRRSCSRRGPGSGATPQRAAQGSTGATASQIDALPGGVEVFLTELREQVRSGIFVPLPVRRAMIPKTGGKLRALGIPTVADRVVQAAIKPVLEPIFEAGFSSSRLGFRPERRAHDAIEDICMHAHNGYVQCSKATSTLVLTRSHVRPYSGGCETGSRTGGSWLWCARS